MGKYLLTLRPMDAFFFGQENKYRKKLSKGKEAVTEADYFQRSAYFPQQTTVLGALRYYLLQINKQLPITEKKIACELIGPLSFNTATTDEDSDFGKIKRLSPVFIVNSGNGKYYMPNQKDLILDDGIICSLEPRDKPGIRNNLSSNQNKIIFMERYKEKDGLSRFLISFDGEDHLLFTGEEADRKKCAFVEEERIGIKKGKDGKTEDKAFYKQVFLRLHEGLEFGCFVEINEHCDVLNEGKTVSMGAEKSIFRISFKECSDDFDALVKIQRNDISKIVLTSDAYIPQDINIDSIFAISSSIPFRFLQTSVMGTKSYSSFEIINHNKSGDKPEEEKPISSKVMTSIRYNLIERGSVFFFDNERAIDNEKAIDKFAKELKNQKNFRQIGYNHYSKHLIK